MDPAASHATVAQTCPKCGRDRLAHESACARCGLLASRFATHRHTSRSAVDPAGLREMWESVVQAWDDPAVHDRYLEEARRLECLPVAARRYRKRLLQAPQDGVAARRLGQIAFLTETIVRSEARHTVPPVLARAMRAASMAFAALFLATSTWAAIMILRR